MINPLLSVPGHHLSEKNEKYNLTLCFYYIFLLITCFDSKSEEVEKQADSNGKNVFTNNYSSIVEKENKHQEEGIEKEESFNWKKDCEDLSIKAKKIMEKRQDKVLMATAINACHNEKLCEEMVIHAYNKPDYSTREHQIDSIKSFQNEIYLDCAKTHQRR